MVFGEGLGEIINSAVTENNGLVQQILGANYQRQLAEGRAQRALPKTEDDVVEGEFVEQKALPQPKTEREKRVRRYHNRIRRSSNTSS